MNPLSTAFFLSKMDDKSKSPEDILSRVACDRSGNRNLPSGDQLLVVSLNKLS